MKGKLGETPLTGTVLQNTPKMMNMMNIHQQKVHQAIQIMQLYLKKKKKKKSN